jgi:hypothetical protein
MWGALEDLPGVLLRSTWNLAEAEAGTSGLSADADFPSGRHGRALLQSSSSRVVGVGVGVFLIFFFL